MKSKPFYKSKTLGGLALSLVALVAIGVGDAGVFELAADLRSQLLALSFVGLGVAGYGRISAVDRIEG